MKSLVDPTRLKPIDKKDGLLQVIVETPAGSRNKFAFDQEQGIFSLKKVLPAGMVFPYDFGFLPQTLAPDGDPIDVLLLMDEPAFPGCSVRARLVGVIEGEQLDGKNKIRNDRLERFHFRCIQGSYPRRGFSLRKAALCYIFQCTVEVKML